ncbi:MAG: PorT family protein [Prevotellaceae bacterium]|jgi:hypothetical protein|nr:PorT family protein [Prevotellaceae bacterium]
MKKIILVLAALLLTVGAQAQLGVKYGVKAGLNMSQLGGGTVKIGGESEDFDASDMLVGFHVGAFLNVGLADIIGLQPEIVYSFQGGNEDGEHTNLHFINVPVLLDIKVMPYLSFLVGPQVGLNVYRSMSYDGLSVSGSTLDDALENVFENATGVAGTGGMKINTLDIAAVIGVQFTVPVIENLTIGARYNFGLTPARGVTSEAKDFGISMSGSANRVIQVSVGWAF